jgi:hypothetical protein
VADDLHVTVHGGAQLAAGNRELARRIAAGAPRDLQPVGEQVRRRIVVPRRSGRMQSSLAVRVVPDGVAVGYTGTAVYAGWVDFGGGRYRARPYIGSGRFLFPVARHPGPGLELAAGAGAQRQIEGMQWPNVTT